MTDTWHWSLLERLHERLYRFKSRVFSLGGEREVARLL